MCTCNSCYATDSAKVWPEYSPDDIRVAKFQRAIDAGKVPNDPVYAAHVRHCWVKFGFTPDLSVHVYKGTTCTIAIPHTWNINDHMRKVEAKGAQS